MGEDQLSFIGRYGRMLRRSSLIGDLEFPAICSYSPTTQDYVDFLATKDWSLYDVLESLTRLCKEEYQSIETQLCELLLVLTEREIYNKHWTGKEWVSVKESEPPEQKESTVIDG